MNKANNGKKRVSEFVKASISIPYSLLSTFDEEAKRLGYTRSEGIRQAMRRQLEIWTGKRF